MPPIRNAWYKCLQQTFVLVWIVGNAYLYSVKYSEGYLVIIAVVFPYAVQFLPSDNPLLKVYKKISLKLKKYGNMVLNGITVAILIYIAYIYAPIIKKLIYGGGIRR